MDASGPRANKSRREVTCQVDEVVDQPSLSLLNSQLIRIQSSCRAHNPPDMPGSPIIQGGIFAVGLAVGVGTASLLLKKQQSTAPTAVAVPTPVPVPSNASFTPSAKVPSPPIMGDTFKMNPAAGSEVAREVFKYGFPGESSMWTRCGCAAACG